MRPVPLTFQRFEASMVPRKTPDGPLLLWATGLGGEVAEVAEAVSLLLSLVVAAGRVQDLVKKMERDGDGPDVRGRLIDHRAEVRKEAGNALFYLHHVLARCGLTLEDAALAQIDLLEALP